MAKTKAKDSYDKVKAKKDELDQATGDELFNSGDVSADIRDKGKAAGVWTSDSGFILEIDESEALALAAWLTDMFSPVP